jgi:hypothetical protein
MRKNTVLLVIVILFAGILLTTIYLSYNRNLRYVDFGNEDSLTKICLIAGVHGNEPAGSLLLSYLVDTTYFKDVCDAKNIFIRVIPAVNEFGLKLGIRYQNNIFHPDINRNFVKGGVDHISKEMIRLTNAMSSIVDFHEGWGFHKIDRNSLGSTLTISESAKNLADRIIVNLNSKINEDWRKFMILDRMCNITNAFSCYCSKNYKNTGYILVETSGQGDVQPLLVRQDQIKDIIDTVLNF